MSDKKIKQKRKKKYFMDRECNEHFNIMNESKTIMIMKYLD